MGVRLMIAEDLGHVTLADITLRDDFGIPATRVLKWGLLPRHSLHRPHLLTTHTVAYTGTHDTNTVVGWFEGLRSSARKDVLDYVGSDAQRFHFDLIRLAFNSVANTVIVPVQDLLGLNSKARMNRPGKPIGNWGWRLPTAVLTPTLGKKLHYPYDRSTLSNRKEEMKMKDSKALLLEYLASVRDPERAALLFADDGVFELPFLRSLGVEPRYGGRREITALLHNLHELYPDFAFAPNETRILIETPEKTFAEYVAHARAAATGRNGHLLFTGYLGAKAGEIKLLRECFNPLAMAQAQLPNGTADVGPPGDEVHSF